jgi:hypothetical protein
VGLLGSNEVYLDRNYGGILIVWDRIFGTFQGETERPRYGLTQNIRSFRPTRVAFHEFSALARDVRAARSWRHRLGYVFRGPGWSPDGSGGGTRGRAATVWRFEPSGTSGGMELSILLVIIGIVLAILVNYILGIIVILIGLAMLLLPRLSGSRGRV